MVIDGIYYALALAAGGAFISYLTRPWYGLPFFVLAGFRDLVGVINYPGSKEHNQFGPRLIDGLRPKQQSQARDTVQKRDAGRT